MINVSIYCEEKINEETRVLDRKAVYNLAWAFIRGGMSKSSAFDRAWDEYNGYYLKEFSTDAPIDQIEYVISSCSKDGYALVDKLMKWDTIGTLENQKIFSRIDWVSYQLERMGFDINPINIKLEVLEKEVSLLPC